MSERVVIYSRALSNRRKLELEKLKRENAAMRAQIALTQYWQIYHAKYTLKDGVIIVS
ncbi:MAG TPA: hypothetical protein VN761_05655 [Candidatus Polarisedimenticolia bacterium]|nr:hypothetical protein [Candidatus Polarisedimenticolia bacterium]